MFAFIATAFMGVANMVGKYFNTKLEISKIKAEGRIAVETAKWTAIAKQAEHEQNWEMAQINQSSWKDEAWTLVILAPLVMSFLPGLQPYVAFGFKNLADMPDWYMALMFLAVAAAFGVRDMAKAAAGGILRKFGLASK